MKSFKLNCFILLIALINLKIVMSTGLDSPINTSIDDDCLTVKRKNPHMKIDCGPDFTKDS